MKYFETFNFDIIIFLTIIVSIISGIYFGLFRQLRKTLVLAGPFVILYFTFDWIMEAINQITSIKTIINKGFGFIAGIIGLSSYENTFYVVIIGIIIYILFALIISIFYSFFKISTHKRLLKKPHKITKILAGILSVVNAYIIILILMYAIKPATDLNYNTPITKLFNQTNNEFVIISKLNQFQNINTENYLNYEAAFSHLSGKTITYEYQELKELYEKIDEINTNIENNLFPNFKDNSKTLINQHLENNDYVTCLLKKVNNKPIFTTIIAYEKSNPEYQQIKLLYEYLIKNRGYLYMFDNYFDNPFNSYTVFEISDIMNTNKESIENEFMDLRAKMNFQNKLNSFSFFNENFNSYKTLIDDNIIDLFEYVTAFNEIITDSERLNQFIDTFLTTFPKASISDPISLSINQALTEYLKYIGQSNQINPNITLATQITLLDCYNDMFIKEFKTLNPLVRAYIIDSVINVKAKGYGLYHEYLFYRYLAHDLPNSPIDIDYMDLILDRLNNLVVEGILTLDQTKIYFENLFISNNGVINNLFQQDKVPQIVIDHLINSNNQFVSDNLKTHLQNL